MANLEATWVNDLRAQLAAKQMEVNEPNIDIEMFTLCLKRLRNWASPGPDGIQGFWIKKFPALYDVLLHHYNVMLRNGLLIPEWFPKGRTMLIPKSSDTSVPKNFRPITCLNILYKLWTACLTELLAKHIQVNSLMHPAQKGCARGQLGCVDHLLLNNRIWHQVKSKNRSLSVSWLDYKKAYDSVPHNWIVWCLQLFRVHPTLIYCIQHLMSLWSTTLYLRMPDTSPVHLTAVPISCGIFQGDTLSPLLFCVSLNPLSLLLDRLSGYQATATRQINHLLYMDDLKLFAKSESQLEVLLRTVHMFSDDVGLSFGLDKCAKLLVTRGRVVPSDSMSLSRDISIRELNVGECYKYLGFFESEGLDCAGSKQKILEMYKRRLSLIWKSYLSGPRKVRATNSFCVPVLTYGFGIIPWTKQEITQMDIQTRKLLTATCNHHPRSAIERLYLP